MNYRYRRYRRRGPNRFARFVVFVFFAWFMWNLLTSVGGSAFSTLNELYISSVSFIIHIFKRGKTLEDFLFLLSFFMGVLVTGIPLFFIQRKKIQRCLTIIETLKNEARTTEVETSLNDFEFDEYEDPRGYTKIFVPEYKHRRLAEEVLGRKLYRNEVVHHIDGVRSNNELANLCVMDRAKHEHFHAWMRWKKEKDGVYPDVFTLKRELKGNVYAGVLLEDIR